jgi:hypothetical protein
LRRLLMQYRVEYGTADTVVLEVPKGSYVTIFSLATQILPKVPLNGVLVSESTPRLTGSSCDFIPAGSLEGSGDRPDLLWRLRRAKRALIRFHASHAGLQSAIIGRREEEALLMNRWALSLQGEGSRPSSSAPQASGSRSSLSRCWSESEPTALRPVCSAHPITPTALYIPASSCCKVRPEPGSPKACRSSDR